MRGPKSSLILTEGDSAKNIFTTIGQTIEHFYDNHGIFPLRGKILNIAKSSTDKIEENVEIKNIMSILGIQ